MLIRLNVDCINCDYSNQGAIVDACINPVSLGYPAAVYIDGTGFIWQLHAEDFTLLNVCTALPADQIV